MYIATVNRIVELSARSSPVVFVVVVVVVVGLKLVIFFASSRIVDDVRWRVFKSRQRGDAI